MSSSSFAYDGGQQDTCYKIGDVRPGKITLVKTCDLALTAFVYEGEKKLYQGRSGVVLDVEDRPMDLEISYFYNEELFPMDLQDLVDRIRSTTNLSIAYSQLFGAVLEEKMDEADDGNLFNLEQALYTMMQVSGTMRIRQIWSDMLTRHNVVDLLGRYIDTFPTDSSMIYVGQYLYKGVEAGSNSVDREGDSLVEAYATLMRLRLDYSTPQSFKYNYTPERARNHPSVVTLERHNGAMDRYTTVMCGYEGVDMLTGKPAFIGDQPNTFYWSGREFLGRIDRVSYSYNQVTKNRAVRSDRTNEIPLKGAERGDVLVAQVNDNTLAVMEVLGTRNSKDLSFPEADAYLRENYDYLQTRYLENWYEEKCHIELKYRHLTYAGSIPEFVPMRIRSFVQIGVGVDQFRKSSGSAGVDLTPADMPPLSVDITLGQYNYTTQKYDFLQLEAGRMQNLDLDLSTASLSTELFPAIERRPYSININYVSLGAGIRRPLFSSVLGWRGQLGAMYIWGDHDFGTFLSTEGEQIEPKLTAKPVKFYYEIGLEAGKQFIFNLSLRGRNVGLGDGVEGSVFEHVLPDRLTSIRLRVSTRISSWPELRR